MISDETKARIEEIWARGFTNALPQLRVVIPDTRWLPRKTKKTWRKFMDGRILNSREWQTIDSLNHKRARKCVRFLAVSNYL